MQQSKDQTQSAGASQTEASGSGDGGERIVVVGPATIVFDDATEQSGTITYADTGEVVTFSEADEVEYVPCFTPGTEIKTAQGEMPVEQITKGTRVLTRDHGYQPVLWTGRRDLDLRALAANPDLRPICITKGALGYGQPERDMTVSPQHRVLIGSPRTELWFGEEEVLVPAKTLTVLDGVHVQKHGAVSYVHFMFQSHELVMSDGCWSESFQPGDLTLSSVDAATREEIMTLFPELADSAAHDAYPAARPTLSAYQARVLLAP